MVQRRGYPDGLKGKEIPIGARILAVADAFDAMTADRPYRKGLGQKEAMQRLIEASGEQFDPEVVDVFKACYQAPQVIPPLKMFEFCYERALLSIPCWNWSKCQQP